MCNSHSTSAVPFLIDLDGYAIECFIYVLHLCASSMCFTAVALPADQITVPTAHWALRAVANLT